MKFSILLAALFVLPQATDRAATDPKEKARVFVDAGGSTAMGVSVGSGIFVGGSGGGKGFSVKVAKRIQKDKACAQTEVTGLKEKADYILVTDSFEFNWGIYRNDGKLVDAGNTALLSTLVREACKAIEKDRVNDKMIETSPVANNMRPRDELRITEGSASEMSNLSGSYAGDVTNTTLGVSAPFAIAIREENGGIYGCTTVQRPLVGSGGFQGTVNGSKVVFEATGKKLRIRFIGELQGDALKGSYTVVSTQEHGEFQLRRENSKAPPVGFDPAQCQKD